MLRANERCIPGLLEILHGGDYCREPRQRHGGYTRHGGLSRNLRRQRKRATPQSRSPWYGPQEPE
jgi:hypothetical protein